MNILEVKKSAVLALVAMVLPTVSLAGTDDANYELTARLNLVGATGTPSNDILGYGLIVHRRLSDDWHLGVSIEHSPEFDVERPNELLDIDSTSETDAVASMTMLTAVAERRYALGEGNWTGFWNLGVGIASIDADNAKGDVEGGGRFDIEVDADTETVLLGGAGFIQRLSESWSARYEATIERHLADWTVTDRVSGASDSYGDYTVSGVRLGVNYRF